MNVCDVCGHISQSDCSCRVVIDPMLFGDGERPMYGTAHVYFGMFLPSCDPLIPRVPGRCSVDGYERDNRADPEP